MTVSTFSLAVTIAGTFIGAGFASGQELWQFFGTWGKWGLLGFVIAALGLAGMSTMTLLFVSKSGNDTFDKIVSPSGNKALKTSVNIFELIFYLSIYIIMTAGVEALICRYFDIPLLIPGIVFAFAVSVVSIIGIKYIIRIFSAVVPLLTAMTVTVAIATVLKSGTVLPDAISLPSADSNFIISAFVYISYNFFAGIGVFASMGHITKSKRRILKGGALSFVFLTVLGCSIILSFFSAGTTSSEMPMFDAAGAIHPLLGIVYAVFLIIAMFGASISSLFPILHSFKSNFKARKLLVIIFAFSVSAVSVTLSLYGFSELIGTVYPIFGYIGFLIAVIIIRNFIKEK